MNYHNLDQYTTNTTKDTISTLTIKSLNPKTQLFPINEIYHDAESPLNDKIKANRKNDSNELSNETKGMIYSPGTIVTNFEENHLKHHDKQTNQLLSSPEINLARLNNIVTNPEFEFSTHNDMKNFSNINSQTPKIYDYSHSDDKALIQNDGFGGYQGYQFFKSNNIATQDQVLINNTMSTQPYYALGYDQIHIPPSDYANSKIIQQDSLSPSCNKSSGKRIPHTNNNKTVHSLKKPYNSLPLVTPKTSNLFTTSNTQLIKSPNPINQNNSLISSPPSLTSSSVLFAAQASNHNNPYHENKGYSINHPNETSYNMHTNFQKYETNIICDLKLLNHEDSNNNKPSLSSSSATSSSLSLSSPPLSKSIVILSPSKIKNDIDTLLSFSSKAINNALENFSNMNVKFENLCVDENPKVECLEKLYIPVTNQEILYGNINQQSTSLPNTTCPKQELEHDSLQSLTSKNISNLENLASLTSNDMNCINNTPHIYINDNFQVVNMTEKPQAERIRNHSVEITKEKLLINKRSKSHNDKKFKCRYDPSLHETLKHGLFSQGRINLEETKANFPLDNNNNTNLSMKSSTPSSNQQQSLGIQNAHHANSKSSLISNINNPNQSQIKDISHDKRKPSLTNMDSSMLNQTETKSQDGENLGVKYFSFAQSNSETTAEETTKGMSTVFINEKLIDEDKQHDDYMLREITNTYRLDNRGDNIILDRKNMNELDERMNRESILMDLKAGKLSIPKITSKHMGIDQTHTQDNSSLDENGSTRNIRLKSKDNDLYDRLYMEAKIKSEYKSRKMKEKELNQIKYIESLQKTHNKKLNSKTVTNLIERLAQPKSKDIKTDRPINKLSVKKQQIPKTNRNNSYIYLSVLSGNLTNIAKSSTITKKNDPNYVEKKKNCSIKSTQEQKGLDLKKNEKKLIMGNFASTGESHKSMDILVHSKADLSKNEYSSANNYIRIPKSHESTSRHNNILPHESHDIKNNEENRYNQFQNFLFNFNENIKKQIIKGSKKF